MKGVVKSIRAGVKRAAVRFAGVVAASRARADGDGGGAGRGGDGGDENGTVVFEVTMDRGLAKALVAHYRDDPEVGSVTDALRQAARDVTRRGE